MHWVISVRLEKRSRALLGSNLTRDIQVEGAPKVHPASGGRRSPEAIFGPPSDTRVMPAKIPRRSRVFHRVLVAYCRQFTTMRTLVPDEPGLRPSVRPGIDSGKRDERFGESACGVTSVSGGAAAAFVGPKSATFRQTVFARPGTGRARRSRPRPLPGRP